MIVPIRPLTEQEFALLRPELEAYIAGLQAQERLKRMIGLIEPGADLDVQSLTLVRNEPEPEPAE